MDEFLLCPAIHYDDGQKHIHAPRNVSTGQVFGGFSLEACLEIIVHYLPEATKRIGFLTSTGRFIYEKGELDFLHNPNEHILCAAIHKTVGTYLHQPTNIEGFVLASQRHHNCFSQAGTLGFASNPSPEHGFLTSKNRFVNRKDAFVIARKNNQIKIKHPPRYALNSEDLY